MALDVVGTVREGVDRAASREAIPIVLAFWLVQVVSTVAVQSQGAELTTREEAPLADTGVFPEGGPLALDVPLPVVSLLSLTSIVLLSLVTVVAIRTFIGGTGGDTAIPEEPVAPGEPVETDGPTGPAHADDPGDHGVSAVSGGVVLPTLWGALALLTFPLLFGLGLAALVLPGLLFAVTMLFVPVRLAVDGDNLLAAMVGSWRLTRGSWLRVLLLLVALLAVVVVVALLGSLPAAAVAAVNPAAGTVLQAAFGGVSLTVVMAVLAVAYTRLQSGVTEDEDDELADIDDELLP